MNTLLVGLDLTEMDANLIRYASLMARDLKFNNVYFIHVAKDLELPDDIIKEYDNVFATVDEGIEQKIGDLIEANFKVDSNITTHIEVKEGNAVDKILRFSKIKNVDLIIMGRKWNLKGSGVVTGSIARKSPCDLLLVPESIPSDGIKNVVVPIDFSQHAALALKHAIRLSKKELVNIKCVNVYTVPSGYSKAGKSYEEFSEIMLGHAKEKYSKFISHFDMDIDCTFLLSKDNDEAETLIDYLNTTKPDLVFVGSKGKTNASVLLLGSMAEKLTKKLPHTPLYVVKQKGEHLGFFEALLKI